MWAGLGYYRRARFLLEVTFPLCPSSTFIIRIFIILFFFFFGVIIIHPLIKTVTSTKRYSTAITTLILYFLTTNNFSYNVAFIPFFLNENLITKGTSLKLKIYSSFLFLNRVRIS